MKSPRLSLAIVAAVWLATLGGLTPRAAGAPTSDRNAAGTGSDDNPSGGDPGQTLEIPQAAPTVSPDAASDSSAALPGSSSNWSDGTHTYTWKDESEGGEPAQQDAPQPSYAGVDEYMNQELQTEAMGPAFTPFFGSPFLVNPYLYSYAYPNPNPYGFGGYSGPYRYPAPAPILSPPPVTIPPPGRAPPPVVSHNMHHFSPLPHFHGHR